MANRVHLRSLAVGIFELYSNVEDSSEFAHMPTFMQPLCFVVFVVFFGFIYLFIYSYCKNYRTNIIPIRLR